MDAFGEVEAYIRRRNAFDLRVELYGKESNCARFYRSEGVIGLQLNQHDDHGNHQHGHRNQVERKVAQIVDQNSAGRAQDGEWVFAVNADFKKVSFNRLFCSLDALLIARILVHDQCDDAHLGRP